MLVGREEHRLRGARLSHDGWWEACEDCHRGRRVCQQHAAEHVAQVVVHRTLAEHIHVACVDLAGGRLASASCTHGREGG